MRTPEPSIMPAALVEITAPNVGCPTSGPWYVYQTDENMEHGPARPDIQVQNPPAIKAEGEDPQLRRAVEALLEENDGADE
jgi:hypothetical protein